MKIIGLGHYSRVGKDTTADALVSALCNRWIPSKKRSFATSLKDVAHQLYGHLGLQRGWFYDQEHNAHLRDVKLPKVQKTPVQIWVELGMAGRNIYGNTWIDLTLRDDCEVLVIPDVRFQNEVDAIKALGGKVVKVVRPGITPRDTVADKALADFVDWDDTVGESGEILELLTWAEREAALIQKLL